MVHEAYRALIVDDEPAVLRLTAVSLEREGFLCDAAADGRSALELLQRQRYDLVVTDLRMPNVHGHSLAVQLLALPQRPVIAVLTGVAEPRLVKDLVARGVDDVTFKPIDFRLLGAKLRAIVNRRTAPSDRGRTTTADAPDVTQGSGSTAPAEAVDLEARLASVSRILPLNPAALDVYTLSADTESVVELIVAAVRQDASLAAEVMRLANSPLYNVTGEPVAKLEDAVLLIGQKRIGELALANTALAALTPGMLPWLDTRMLARRSIAAGLAIELLLEEGRYRNNEGGLVLGAMMYGLGRIVMGTLFPQSYERMLANCARSQSSLWQAEVAEFGESQASVMARLLKLWRIPQEAYLPLKYADDGYASLVALPELLRTRVELIKLAVLIGQLTAATWQPWDHVELPPPLVLRRLRIDSLRDIVDRVRQLLVTSSPGSAEVAAAHDPQPRLSLAYYNLSGGSEDTLSLLLDSLGFRLITTSREITDAPLPPIVNCLDAPLHRLFARIDTHSAVRPIIVCKPEALNDCSKRGIAASLPGSFASLLAPFEQLAER